MILFCSSVCVLKSEDIFNFWELFGCVAINQSIIQSHFLTVYVDRGSSLIFSHQSINHSSFTFF